MQRQQLGPERLIEAAAQLMDASGIDQVSTNEIIRFSGHRNRSAIAYHFGSRDELVRAVLRRTMNGIDTERTALLDHLEATGAELSARTIIEVLVGPLTRQLRAADGRRYLRLCAQVLDHPRFVADLRDAISANSSVARCAQLAAPFVSQLPPFIRMERASQLVGFLIRSCADQARLLDTASPRRPPLDIERFTVNMVDTVLALLLAPSSLTDAPAGLPGPTPVQTTPTRAERSAEPGGQLTHNRR